PPKKLHAVEAMGVRFPLQEAQAGSTIEELCRRHGISAATYYKWKQKFGGLEVEDAQLIFQSRLWHPARLEEGVGDDDDRDDVKEFGDNAEAFGHRAIERGGLG